MPKTVRRDRPVWRRQTPLLGVVVLALLTLSLSIVSCGGGTSAGGESTTTAPVSGGGGAQVVMKDIAFDPQTITIKAGERVIWTNEDSAPHTVVADGGEFESGRLAKGDTFTFMFATSGTYTYYCSVHPSMKGTVVVE